MACRHFRFTQSFTPCDCSLSVPASFASTNRKCVVVLLVVLLVVPAILRSRRWWMTSPCVSRGSRRDRSGRSSRERRHRRKLSELACHREHFDSRSCVRPSATSVLPSGGRIIIKWRGTMCGTMLSCTLTCMSSPLFGDLVEREHISREARPAPSKRPRLQMYGSCRASSYGCSILMEACFSGGASAECTTHSNPTEGTSYGMHAACESFTMPGLHVI